MMMMMTTTTMPTASNNDQFSKLLHNTVIIKDYISHASLHWLCEC